MAWSHPYTTRALDAEGTCFVERSPGAVDLERLFPSPSSSGRGRLAMEGGVSVVAGPGMGKTSLLAHLSRRLDQSRNLATARVSLAPATRYPKEGSFYDFLGDLILRLHGALRTSPRMSETAFAPLAGVLAAEPEWDAPGSERAMTPRGVARWIATLGAAAVHTPGVCLLFDDVDAVAGASWKVAFVAALRFTFQTSAGITPVYAVWSIFADESLPGSNYFRNVTRPVFLEPLGTRLDARGDGPSERRALVDVGLPRLPPVTAARLFQLTGGHPQLLQRALIDLCERLPDADAAASLGPADLDAVFTNDVVEGQRRLAAELLGRTPNLGAALRVIARGEPGGRPLARGLLATGLVDREAGGRPVLPERVAEVL